MEEFTTIQELDTPIKLTRFLFFYDLLFIAFYTFITYRLLENFVYSKIQFVYLLNCVLWGVFFIIPAVGNSRRKNWQNILNTLINMNAGVTYQSEIGREEEDEEK